MILPILSLALASGPHPEWGPEPPVAPYGKTPLPSAKVVVPMIFPVLGQSRWKDGYGDSRGIFLHTGIDIRAPKMTPIVAPISGTIGLKRESFWIYGDNGWAILGTHLNDDNLGTHDHKGDRDVMFCPSLVPGQHVRAGQFIGYVGESGDATAPHLHFELYSPGSGRTAERIRNPFPSLKSAQVISKPLAMIANREQRPPKGQIRIQGCIRRVDRDHGFVTVLMTAKQLANGATTPITQVRYLRVRVPAVHAQAAGGWEGLGRLQTWRTVALYLPESGNPVDATVRRIVVASGPQP